MGKWIAGAVCAVVVACGAADDLAGEFAADAGQLLVDAGAAIADAGAQLAEVDAATVADAQAAPVTRTRESACSVERTATPIGAGTASTETYAVFDVDADEVRQVWACDSPRNDQACPTGGVCTGADIPKPVCRMWTGYEAGGKLWVPCASYTRVRVILD